MANIDIELANGQKAGETLKALTFQAAALRKEISTLKPGTEDFAKASESLNQVKSRMGDIQDKVNATVKASDALKAAWNKMPFSGPINDAIKGLAMARAGVGGLVSQMGVLKVAIASTGIGLLIVALGSLYTWFTKTEEGADTLKKILYPLQVIFQNIKGVVAELGGKIFEKLKFAFTNPLQAIKDLGAALWENIINRFKAIAVFGEGIVQLFNGEFKKGFKTLADSAIQWTTGFTDGTDKIVAGLEAVTEGMEKAWETGNKLVDLENAIEDAEVAITVARAKNNVALREQEQIYRDVLEEDQDRLDAANQFVLLQDQMMAQEENLLKLKMQKLIIEQDMDKILTDDEKLERAKLEADLIQLQATNLESKRKALTAVHSLEKELREKAVGDFRLMTDLQIEAMADQEEREVAALNEKFHRQIVDLQLQGEQKKEAEKLLEETRLREVQEIRDKYATERKEKEDKDAEEKKKSDEKSKKEELDREKAITSAKADLANSALDAAVDLLSMDEKARKRNAVAIRAFTVGQIVADTQREIAGYMANPASTATFGVAGTLKSIAAVIRAGIAIAKVKSQEFKFGGIPDGRLVGPSHAAGGIPIVAEGNEIVLTKGVFQTPSLRAMASAINVAGGGRRFDLGGPVNPFSGSSQTTASAPATSTASSDPITSALARIELMFMMYANKVEKWQRELKVNNNVIETRDGINVINKLENESNV